VLVELATDDREGDRLRLAARRLIALVGGRLVLPAVRVFRVKLE
jgi:hypothetical protein